MPFSPNNPNRNRNYIILILSGVVVFALIMGAYVALSIAGQDTDAFLRFLTIVVVTIIPSGLAAIRANVAATHSQIASEKATEVAETVSEVKETLNGTLDERMRQASRDVSEEEGRSGRPTV